MNELEQSASELHVKLISALLSFKYCFSCRLYVHVEKLYLIEIGPFNKHTKREVMYVHN